MTQVLGEVLPAALGVALSPIVIIAIVLTLSSPRGSASGIAFVAGWTVSLSAMTAAMIVVTDDVYGSPDQRSTGGWTNLILGLALLAMAVKKWRGRPRPGDPPRVPGWMKTFDSIAPPRAAVVAAAVAGANPKHLAFTLAAASSMATLGLSDAESVTAGAIYVLLASSTVLGAVAVHLVAGARANTAFVAVKEFMLAHNDVIIMVILAIFGAKLVGDGLALV